MPEYREEPLEIVNNEEYTYYKLYVDEKCYFDEFYEEVVDDVRYCNKMAAIITYMDELGAQLIPKEKFRNIKGLNRSDVFEFKKKPLRVYVIKQKPNIYVVMGGYKNEQKNDISILKKRIKDFPEIKE